MGAEVLKIEVKLKNSSLPHAVSLNHGAGIVQIECPSRRGLENQLDLEFEFRSNVCPILTLRYL